MAKQKTFESKMKDLFGEDIDEYIITEESQLDAISTGALSLDTAIGLGGIPKGRYTVIYGPEGCLIGDTFIRYETRIGNKRVNNKGGTIASLYKKFHANSQYDYFVSSINENNCIIKNLIADVVDSGEKPVYKVTASKYFIESTDDHEFYIGEGKYKSLKNLVVGDTIYIHDSFQNTKTKTKRRYQERYVKYHPSSHFKTVNGSIYCRVKYSHLVLEAFYNSLLTEDYIYILNTWTKEQIDRRNFWTVPNGYDVHHKDKDPDNNMLFNLELVEKKAHYKMHALESQDNLRFVAVPFKIDSIEEIGVKHVYDIKCVAPYNNYVANNFVVHNCGKSTIALSIARNAIKGGDKVLYVDVENQMHFTYIEQLLGESIQDGGNFILAKPQNSDQAFKIMEAAIESNEYGLVILDTVAALSPIEEQENPFEKASMTIISRDLAKFFRRNSPNVRRNHVAVLFVNQVRDKIGAYIPTLDMPGGHALRHMASVVIQMSKGKDIEVGETTIGINTRFNIKKNKVGSPFKEYIIPIIFGVGVDSFRDIVSYAKDLGVIRLSGAWYYYGDTVLGQGMTGAMDYLSNNQEVLDKIKETCYNIVNTKLETEGDNNE